MAARTICVDFDGVLHSYTSGWKGADVIPDPPVPGAIEFLRYLQENGYRVVIHTTRAESDAAVTAIRAWLRICGMSEAESARIRITNMKVPAEVYVDDRAYRFNGVFPSRDELEQAARPWNKPNRR